MHRKPGEGSKKQNFAPKSRGSTYQIYTRAQIKQNSGHLKLFYYDCTIVQTRQERGCNNQVSLTS